jgi:hypothetical protein
VTKAGDGFLARWSRLKRDQAAPPAPQAPAAPAPAPADEAALPEGKTREELIAALPKLEDLVPGQSLADFMRPWVPAALRHAALRRMWLLDPAISGYVDPALDYAYDYNTLGAAPGFGPMQASPEQVREVSEMFDRALGVQPAAADGPAPGETQEEPAQGEPGAVLQARAAEITGATGETPDGDREFPPAETGVAPASSGYCAVQNGPDPVEPAQALVRRHGRALPT